MSRLKRELLLNNRSEAECCWCKKIIQASEITLEHIMPKSCGGTEDFDNLALACHKCNTTRPKCGRAKCWYQHNYKLPIGKRRKSWVERIENLLTITQQDPRTNELQRYYDEHLQKYNLLNNS
jgi:5-methylcytosine-specific restriction endonuclease McrA